MSYTHYYQGTIGVLEIIAEEQYIIGISLQKQDKEERLAQGGVCQPPKTSLLREACNQLDEYFAGERTIFTLPIAYPHGTSFQHYVWNALRDIPYGETRSYEDIAKAIGNPKAVRAIGQANTRNPILLLVPCHRVINKNGTIGGFGCGVEVKKQLLQLEGVNIK